jgi:pimeloyl-ACP methyl ester carboxylesterase
MRGYVGTRWGQLHYSSTGSGSTAIVLLHETPLNHSAFGRIVPLLDGDFRVVAFDSPGYGQSDGPGQPTTAQEYAKTFAEGIEALGLDRIVLYGVHTGATFAVQLAASIPERVAGLAMSGVPFYTDEVRRARRVREVPTVAEDGSHLTDTFEWEPAAYDPLMRSRLVAGVSLDPDNAYLAFHAVYGFEPAKVFGQLACPALLLSHPLDPLFDFDNRFAAAVPGTRQVIVESERLPVYWTSPETVAAELAALARSGTAAG